MLRLFTALACVPLFVSGIASAQYIPAGFWRTAKYVPSIDFDFLTTTTLPATLTHTRSTVGYYYDSSGTLTSAAANTPRWDYDPSTLALKGLLLEPAATNYQIYSHPVSTTGYYTQRTTLTLNDTTAPDGSNTATRVTETSGAGTGNHIVGSGLTGTAASTVYTTSVYVKPGTINAFSIVVNNRGNTSWGSATYSLVGNGSVLTTNYAGVLTASGIQKVANGWYRAWATWNPGTGANEPVPSYYHYNTTSNTMNYDAGTRQYYYWIWGAQTEQGSAVTSYIPTSATAVTRGADQVVFNTLTWYRWDEGTMFAQFINSDDSAGAVTRAFGVYRTNSAATFTDNGIDLADNGTANASAMRSATVAYFSPTGTLNSAGNVNKVALGYKVNSFVYVANNGTPVTGSSGFPPSVIAYAYIGTAPNGVMRTRWMQKIKYYRQRIPDAQTKSLTQ